MPETQPSNLRIHFGLGGDDSTYEVKNVVVKFNSEYHHNLNGRNAWEARGYKQVKIFYDCKGLHIIGKGSSQESDGELFYPITSIFNIAVDWMDDYKGDQA